MLIFVLRTDKPEAEIGLYEDEKQLAYETWQAHRQLAETLHSKIEELLEGSGKDWSDIQAVVAYEGPGSFTGLRIGLSVANALAAGLGVPIVGGTGEDWQRAGFQKLKRDEIKEQVLPVYGADVHITPPKK